MARSRTVDSPKVWTTLITNTKYLSGLLALDYCLKKQKTKYPLLALYTDTFPEEGHRALDVRGIPKQRVEYLLPSTPKDFPNDPRFYDCWSKLIPFSMIEYERVVQLDSDMTVLHNMDELMNLELDPPSLEGKGDRVFAAAHACTCNAWGRDDYPKDWVPETCAFRKQLADPDAAQIHGPSSKDGLGICNGGVQVVNPSTAVYELIINHLNNANLVENFFFADQSLLSDLFQGRWVGLSYIYNALKHLQWVHPEIWQDDKVKIFHFLQTPKPWQEDPNEPSTDNKKWFLPINNERLREEKENGIDDGF